MEYVCIGSITKWLKEISTGYIKLVDLENNYEYDTSKYIVPAKEELLKHLKQ